VRNRVAAANTQVEQLDTKSHKMATQLRGLQDDGNATVHELLFRLKDLCKDINFDCSEKMDSSHFTFVSLLRRVSAFSDFKRERPASAGMKADPPAEILNMCGTSDSLKLP